MPPRKRPKPKAVAHPSDDEASTSGSDREGDQLLRAGARQRRRLGRSTRGAVSTFFLPQNTGGSRTLAELRLDHGGEAALRDLLARLPERHPNEKRALRAALEARFGAWWADWRAGNSLLFYGFGSKRDLLDHFARSCTSDGACLVVDGLHQGLTARQVLAWAAAAARQGEAGSYRQRSTAELLEMIAAEGPHRWVYVVIHNIEGLGQQPTSLSSRISAAQFGAPRP